MLGYQTFFKFYFKINTLILILHLENIKLRFFRLHKHSTVMKLLNESNILIYRSQSEIGKLEVLKMIDQCDFKTHFNTMTTNREDFYLNLRDRLVIVIDKMCFLYSAKNNTINKLANLNENHRGGSMVYVPMSNSIFCISGFKSPITEKMTLGKNMEFSESREWVNVCSLNDARGYFSCFVQNDSLIYLLFGLNISKGEFVSNIQRLDTLAEEPNWITIKIKSEKIPKLHFCACIPATDEEIYILGGRDETKQENSIIYLYDVPNQTIEDSGLRLPIFTGDDGKTSMNLFYQENNFIAVRPEKVDDYKEALLLAMFDTKNILHLVNIKNLEYSFISSIADNENANQIETGTLNEYSTK